MVLVTICWVIGGISFSNLYIGSVNIFKYEHFAGFKLFARFIKRLDIIAHALWNNDSRKMFKSRAILWSALRSQLSEQTGFSFSV